MLYSWLKKTFFPTQTKPVQKPNAKGSRATKKPSPFRLLNSKTSFADATAFYDDLAPTSRQKLKKSLQTTHNNKPYIQMRKLYVGPSSLPPVAQHGGRGVFAGETFEEGDIVEICPLLLDQDKMWEPKNPDSKNLPAHEFYTIAWGPDWFAVEEKGVTKSGKNKFDVKTSLGPWEPADWKESVQSSSESSTTSPSDRSAPAKEYKAPTSHLTFVPAETASRKKSPWKIEMSAIMLGYGSLYNHARRNSNVEWHFGADATVMFVALRDIEVGEELFVDYGDEYWTSEGGSVPDAEE